MKETPDLEVRGDAEDEIVIMTIVEKPINWKGTCRECDAESFASNMKGSELSHECTSCGDEYGVMWTGISR